MRKIVDYIIVDEHNAINLKRVVLEHMEIGWQPFGSMSILSNPLTQNFFQPMVMYEEESQNTDSKRSRKPNKK